MSHPSYPPPPGPSDPYGAPPAVPDYGSSTPPGYPVAPGYGAPGYGAPGAYGYPPQRRTNGMAVGSLIASLVGFATCVGWPVGIILGHIALKQIKQTGEDGGGMAKAGLIIGYICTILAVLGTIAYIVLIVWLVGQDSSTTTYSY